MDDTLHVGNQQYCKMSRHTEEEFKCKPREYDRVQFEGVHIEKLEEGS